MNAVLVLVLAAAALARGAAADCSLDSYTKDLAGSQYMGLAPVAGVESLADCAAACCSRFGCRMIQYGSILSPPCWVGNADVSKPAPYRFKALVSRYMPVETCQNSTAYGNWSLVALESAWSSWSSGKPAQTSNIVGLRSRTTIMPITTSIATPNTTYPVAARSFYNETQQLNLLRTRNVSGPAGSRVCEIAYGFHASNYNDVASIPNLSIAECMEACRTNSQCVVRFPHLGVPFCVSHPPPPRHSTRCRRGPSTAG